MNILITGGTGLLGQRLVDALQKKSWSPKLLSRSRDLNASAPKFAWGIEDGIIDEQALDKADAIIHLAGANIADGRWTNSRKKEILDSRINSTRLLYESLEKRNDRPKTLICASATGFYGLRDFEHESHEDEASGSDFLAQVCYQWETEADRFSKLGMRVVKVRTGVVFDSAGGALQKMAQPIQYIPWIHWEDWCGAVLHLLQQNGLSGAFNLVAPQPVTNAELTRLLAKIIGRPLVLPNVPAFVLKTFLGEMSSVVLNGNKVSSIKLMKSGYNFNYESVDKALHELLSQD